MTTPAPRPRDSAPAAVLALVAANAVPLVGVVAFGWSLHTLLVLYWLENGVVGALYVPRILLAGADPPPDAGPRWWVGETLGASAGVAAFFTMHYGIFWVVHGVFVLLFPVFVSIGGVGGGEALAFADPEAVGAGAIGLVASHGVSFVRNYLGAEEYRTTDPEAQMWEPYGRVVALHVTIVVGAVVAAALGTPTVALVVFVLLKTGADLAAHLREHRRARSPGSGSD